jgi:hypothetical protein
MQAWCLWTRDSPHQPDASTTLNKAKICLDKWGHYKATELHLVVERKLHSHQGQVQGMQSEVDEEVWSKGIQGWKLKRRTINQKVGWTDVS